MHRRSRASQEDSDPDDSDGDVSPASYGRSLTSRAALSYGMLAGGNGHPTPPKALSVGSFVWARVPGLPAWPARVVDVERAAARPKTITPHVTSPQEPSYHCAVEFVGTGDEAALPADVEDLAAAAEDGGQDARVAGEPTHGLGAEV